VLGLGLLGCHDSALQHTQGDLVVETTTLTFPLTWVGSPSQVALPLVNRSASPRQVTLTLEGPGAFQLAPQLTVAGGAASRTPVTFAPSAAGPAQGTVTVAWEGHVVVVTLVAQAQVPPACALPDPCHHLRFDPDQGRCVDTSDPDGTDCSAANRCLSGATCQAGACVGTALSCDDDNVCTRDLCDAVQGCVHQDTSAACPAASDPCHVAFCDPSDGCGTTDAADGTVCGSVDCATAHVCLFGSCVGVPVPDGTLCLPETACTDASYCQGGACPVPGMHPLREEWSLPVSAATSYVLFPGLADSHDQLYWAEQRTVTLPDGTISVESDLVSTTRDGLQRFRVTTQAAIQDASTMLLAGDLLVFRVGADGLEAHRQRDGKLAWTASLGHLLWQQMYVPEPTPSTNGSGTGDAWYVSSVAAGAPGQLVATVSYTPAPAPLNNSKRAAPGTPRPPMYRGAVAAIDLATGRLAWAAPIDGSPGPVISDAAGDLFIQGSVFTDAAGTSYPRLYSLGLQGEVRWTADSDYAMPVAASEDVLMVATYDYVDTLADGGQTDGGEQIFREGQYGWGYRNSYMGGQGATLLRQGQGFLVDDNQGFFEGDVAPPRTGVADAPVGGLPELAGFDPVTGLLQWRSQVFVPHNEYYWYGLVLPVLTDRGTLLIATSGSGDVPYVPVQDPLPDGGVPPPIDVDAGPYPWGAGTLQEWSAGGQMLYACPLPDRTGDYQNSLGGAVLLKDRWVRVYHSGYPDARIQAFAAPGLTEAPEGWTTPRGSQRQAYHPR
jgi:hypothetical protein